MGLHPIQIILNNNYVNTVPINSQSIHRSKDKLKHFYYIIVLKHCHRKSKIYHFLDTLGTDDYILNIFYYKFTLTYLSFIIEVSRITKTFSIV
jgi:hypothetical protein